MDFNAQVGQEFARNAGGGNPHRAHARIGAVAYVAAVIQIALERTRKLRGSGARHAAALPLLRGIALGTRQAQRYRSAHRASVFDAS